MVGSNQGRIRAIGVGTYLSMHGTTKMTLIRQNWNLQWKETTRKENKRERGATET